VGQGPPYNYFFFYLLSQPQPQAGAAAAMRTGAIGNSIRRLSMTRSLAQDRTDLDQLAEVARDRDRLEVKSRDCRRRPLRPTSHSHRRSAHLPNAQRVGVAGRSGALAKPPGSRSPVLLSTTSCISVVPDDALTDCAEPPSPRTSHWGSGTRIVAAVPGCTFGIRLRHADIDAQLLHVGNDKAPACRAADVDQRTDIGVARDDDVTERRDDA
jgi:hypothetical protein